MMRSLLAGLVVGLMLASPAWADTIPNPFVQAYGGAMIAGVEVHYRDGVLPRYQDSAAARYAERRLGGERRAEFEALAQPRGLTPQTSAERMAEYLAESDLRARAGQGSRRVNIAVTVRDANVQDGLSVLGAVSPSTPTLDYE